MYYMAEEDTLQHWGIKGMKWGLRRYQNEDGTRTAAGKKRAKASKMSDADLNATLRRMRLEDEYDQRMATRKQNTAGGKLKKTFKKAAVGAVAITGGAIVKSVADKAVKEYSPMAYTATKRIATAALKKAGDYISSGCPRKIYEMGKDTVINIFAKKDVWLY